MSAGLVSAEASLLGSQMATFLLPCVLTGSFLGVCTSGVLSYSYKDSSLIGSGPCPISTFNLNYLPEGPTSKSSLTGG